MEPNPPNTRLIRRKPRRHTGLHRGPNRPCRPLREDLTKRIDWKQGDLVEIEVYSCGCKVRIYEVEFGESKNDLTERPSLISDYSPCSKHRNARRIPPREAPLLQARGANEALLDREGPSSNQHLDWSRDDMAQ